MNLTGLNLIGYDQSGKASRTFQAIEPSTQKPLDGAFYEATAAEVDLAVKKAEAAFLTYRIKTNEERARFLEDIADEILEVGDQLVSRCSAETGLPEQRLHGEKMRTVNQLRLFAEVVSEGSWVDARIDTAQPDRQPLPKPDIRQMQIPLGPVGVFGASNFPLAFSVAGGDTASALAAGCPVIVKAHPLHPGTSEIVGQAILRAARRSEMPDGVFSMIHGPSVDTGMALVMHPNIAAIGFTGSFKGGKAIFDAANQRETPIPVFAEMGSVNPVFILPGAMKERKTDIAKGLAASITLGVGQFCTNPGLIVTEGPEETESFIRELGQAVSGTAPGVMLSEAIRNNYLSGVKKFQGVAGVKAAAAGQASEDGNKVAANIFTTDCDTFSKNKELSEEVFGPSSLNVYAQNKDEAIKIAENMAGHLTATVHGTERDLEEYSLLIRTLERKVGRIIFNGYPTGVEVCHSMVHGGPYPATTAPHTTSVGTAAIRRFSRPVCYQDFPQAALPEQLQNGNLLDIWRLVNGRFTKEAIES